MTTFPLILVFAALMSLIIAVAIASDWAASPLRGRQFIPRIYRFDDELDAALQTEAEQTGLVFTPLGAPAAATLGTGVGGSGVSATTTKAAPMQLVPQSQSASSSTVTAATAQEPVMAQLGSESAFSRAIDSADTTFDESTQIFNWLSNEATTAVDPIGAKTEAISPVGAKTEAISPVEAKTERVASISKADTQKEMTAAKPKLDKDTSMWEILAQAEKEAAKTGKHSTIAQATGSLKLDPNAPKEWVVGMALDQVMGGTKPSPAIKAQRYWQTIAQSASTSQYDQEELERMAEGRPPRRYNPIEDRFDVMLLSGLREASHVRQARMYWPDDSIDPWAAR